MTKIIANYLPQFHRIPENDAWWGDGFTDWVATKNAKPLFAGHNQPKKPLNDNYYDLSCEKSLRWQASIASNAGIYGFGIYHYWFNSNLQLLQKPAEIILNSDISINFMFIWDNASWKRTWGNIKNANDWAPLYENNSYIRSNNGILAELIYGSERDWIKHFNYLLPFFKDHRYIRNYQGKPLFMFFNTDSNTEILTNIADCWNKLAISNGLPGICFLERTNKNHSSIFDFRVDYEPVQHGWNHSAFINRILEKAIFFKENKFNQCHLLNYDKLWGDIIKSAKNCKNDTLLFGSFVNYDDSPRRGRKGRIVCGATPYKFQKYMTELLKICSIKNKEFLFLTAWNEWGEGAYLEPDELNGYSYLDAIKNAINDSSNS